MVWPAAACLLGLAALPLAVLVDQPVTITVAVPEPVRHAQAVILRLQGVVMRRDAPANWNVFWDLSKAATSVEDLHFVGSIHSPANTALRDPKPANFILQMPAAALTALRRQSTMRLTFVPIGKLPDGGVTITSIRLE